MLLAVSLLVKVGKVSTGRQNVISSPALFLSSSFLYPAFSPLWPVQGVWGSTVNEGLGKATASSDLLHSVLKCDRWRHENWTFTAFQVKSSGGSQHQKSYQRKKAHIISVVITLTHILTGTDSSIRTVTSLVKIQTLAFVHNCTSQSSSCCTLPFLTSALYRYMWLAAQYAIQQQKTNVKFKAWLVDWSVYNGTFSTKRLYCAMRKLC